MPAAEAAEAAAAARELYCQMSAEAAGVPLVVVDPSASPSAANPSGGEAPAPPPTHAPWPPPSLALLQFSNRPQTELPLTPLASLSADAWAARLDGLVPLGQGTCVSSALAGGAATLAGLPPGGRKAIVLVTDGQFEASHAPLGWGPPLPPGFFDQLAAAAAAGGPEAVAAVEAMRAAGVGGVPPPQPPGPPVPPPAPRPRRPGAHALHPGWGMAGAGVDLDGAALPPPPIQAAASLGTAGIALFVWAVGRTAGEEAMRTIVGAARAAGGVGGGGCEAGGFMHWHSQKWAPPPFYQ